MKFSNLPAQVSGLGPLGLVTVLVCMAHAAVHAQTTPGQLLQDIRSHQPQTHDLPAPSSDKRLEVRSPSVARESQVQFVVKQFEFQGNRRLSTDVLQSLLADWLGRAITFADLKRGTDAIVELYREQGFLARVLLPPQDITEGLVRIQVVEARFGGLNIQNQSLRIPDDTLRSWVARQLQTGSDLNLVALDHALLTLDDLPSISASGFLQEGEQPGETSLVLTVQDKQAFAGQGLLDNFGDQNTGKVRAAAQINVNGLIDWADQLSLYGLRTQGSTYARVGWTTTTASATRGQRLGVYASTMDYRISTSAFRTARITGGSEVWGLEASDPVIRSRSANVVASFNWAHSRFKSWSDGVLNERTQGSQVAQFGVSGNWLDAWQGGGTGTASLMASLGNIDWGQSPDTYAVGGIFSKLRYGLMRTQTLAPGWQLHASLTGQIASRNMDSSEQLYLGGPLNVRAYASGQGSASQGQLYAVELRKQLPEQTQLVLFYDEARAQTWKSNPASNNVANHYSLRGVGVGLNWMGPAGLQIKTTWAHRLGQPRDSVSSALAQSGGLDRHRFWLNASVPF